MWNLKENDTNELTYKTETLTENKHGYQRRLGGEGIGREFGTDMFFLLYFK